MTTFILSESEINEAEISVNFNRQSGVDNGYERPSPKIFRDKGKSRTQESTKGIDYWRSPHILSLQNKAFSGYCKVSGAHTNGKRTDIPAHTRNSSTIEC